MSSHSSLRIPSPEDVTKVQETMIKLVADAMVRRDAWAEFREAFDEVLDLSDFTMSPEHQRLWDAAVSVRDEAVRTVVELVHTAAVMQVVGEFPSQGPGSPE